MGTEELEPLMPVAAELESKGGELLSRASRIGRGLHPDTVKAIADLLRTVNCYYSNLIEGHDTHPVDIERAMRKDYAVGSFQRDLQEEARAHIEVQVEVEARVHREPKTNPCSKEFLLWIHREFYNRTANEFRTVRDPESSVTKPVVPGALRDYEVKVGKHLPPHHNELPELLARLEEAYDPLKHNPAGSLVALAAANHRMLWVHPFGDGNGRVVRLMTDAYLLRLGIASYGLWNVSRGLARNKQRYLLALEEADSVRRNDYDGRGALSMSGLTSFCTFFLDICLDQVHYMEKLLDVDGLAKRIEAYGKAREMGSLPGAEGSMGSSSTYREEMTALLLMLVYRGKLDRSEVERVTGLKDRTARRVVSGLEKEGFIASESSRAPLRLRIPAHAAPYIFPKLYSPIN